MNFTLTRPRIILMIGDDGVIVVPFEIPNAAPFFTPTDDRHALPEIFDFIAQHPQARITLFADNLAQDYRCDTLPRLNFFDRAKLIDRRLKQNFPTARLTAGLRFKKSRDRVLMIGLHESNPVFAWADKLRARLPDISLLPVEGARLTARLMPEAATGWAMTISRQKSGGFRQIVTFCNDLVFTRLTPLPPDAFDDDAEILARDIKASLDYLTRQGLRDPRELSVLLLMPDDFHASPAFDTLSLKSIKSMSPFAAAKTLGLPFAPQENENTADLLFAAGLLSQPRAVLSLMLPDARQVWLTHNIQKWGLRAASVAAFAVALLTIWRAGDLATTLYQAQKESIRLEEMHQTLAQAQAHAAPVTEPLGRLRQAVERQHIYAQPVPMPWQGLTELAGSRSEDTKIVKLEWKKENDNAPDIFNIALRMTPTDAPTDRAATVAAFTSATQDIARATPDYTVSVTKPPYPSLPQESVTAATPNESDEPTGEITLQRKNP